jgi:hypothetical protein
MRKAGWFMAALFCWAGGARSQKTTSGRPGGDAADKAAFEAVCGACHPASMASDVRSESDWKDTVEVMVKAGAKGHQRTV